MDYLHGIKNMTVIHNKYARILLGKLGQTFSDYQTLAKVLNVLEEPFMPADAKEFHDLIDEFGKQYFHPESAFAHSF
ncbi:endonuclease-3 related protein [Ligilactobacillus sp. WC1T17]|uniref:Endonuclease-3 related protein n=1 Tax=Ligilactobacillus ruminis TaxID=1623 RepID=A0ABY1AC23_9LACO|nr:endonuclease-3 related protein [Ligilactobacillus ruminis]